MLTACVSGGPAPKSNWEVLGSAESAKCAAWPMRPKDLGVNRIALAVGKAPAFAVSATKRDTSSTHYFAPFDDDPSLDAERFAPLDLGRGAVLLGASTLGGKPYVFVARNAGGKATLEVRSAVDNVVRFKTPLVDVAVEGGFAVAAPTGAWLSVEGDDGSHRLVFVDLGGKMALRAIPAATHGEAPRILVRAAQPKGALLVWKEGDTGSPFKAQWVGEDGKADAAVAVDLPIGSQIESWSAAGHAGGYYVAVVDGDSLVGSSELKIAYLNWDGSVPQTKWTKSVKLVDEHVTEPVFLASEAGLEVLVLKWIDEESTIARYMVAAANVGKPTFSGVFPKGSLIVAAFTNAGGDDRFVLVRSRAEQQAGQATAGWIFRLCEI